MGGLALVSDRDLEPRMWCVGHPQGVLPKLSSLSIEKRTSRVKVFVPASQLFFSVEKLRS
jgi:hypothetical protein